MKRNHLFSIVLVLVSLSILPTKALLQCEFTNSIVFPLGLDIPCPTTDWELVFSDEFDGATLDITKWQTEYSSPAPADRTLFPNNRHQGQLFRDENLSVSNGTLKITAKRENATYSGFFEDDFNSPPELVGNLGDPFSYSFKYTSGVLVGKQPFNATEPLLIEARIKIPRGNGLMPAFWTFTGLSEIDFFEVLSTNSDTEFTSSIHNWVIDERCSKEETRPADDFHLWQAEITPTYVRIFLDNELKITFERFRTVLHHNQPVGLVCGQDLPPGIYQESIEFPDINSFFAPYLSLAVERDQADSETVGGLPAVMEVDYVRVYKKSTCAQTSALVVTTNTTITGNQSYDRITVNNGAELTIEDAMLQMGHNGVIEIEHGSALILSNAVIDAACVKWEGIRARGNSSVTIIRDSRILNARTGVRLDELVFEDSPIPALSIVGQSSLENCNIGVRIEGGNNDLQLISDGTKFIDNDIGISVSQHSGLVVEQVVFTDNGTAISSLDAYISVRDDCSFLGGHTGIHVEGTFPMSSGIDVGDAGSGSNFFGANVLRGIVSSGSEHPAGVHVINCHFSDVAALATGFTGYNDLHFANNTVDNTNVGLMAWSTGDNENDVMCNVYDDITSVDNFFLWTNEETEFLENHSVGTHTVNYGFAGATMKAEIGRGDNPAANCFSDNSTDIVTVPFLVAGTPFTYHYYDDGLSSACQEPINTGNFVTERSEATGNHCDGNIGIFNLIDPDGDGENGVVPSEDDPSIACTECIKDSINAWIVKVVNDDGDDPRTVEDEEKESPAPTLAQNKEIMDQWIQYGLYVALETQNDALAEEILSPLLKWRWQKRLYGLRVLQEDYTAAQLLLDAMPENDTNHVYFKEVQRTNLKRLQLNGANWIDSSELDQLRVIAESHYPSKGYAASLYRLLTGEEITSGYPDLSGQTNPRSIEADNTNAAVSIVYPNPVSSELILDTKGRWHMKRIDLFNASGQLVLQQDIDSDYARIHVSALEKGVYFASIVLATGHTVEQKLLIHSWR